MREDSSSHNPGSAQSCVECLLTTLLLLNRGGSAATLFVDQQDVTQAQLIRWELRHHTAAFTDRSNRQP